MDYNSVADNTFVRSFV